MENKEADFIWRRMTEPCPEWAIGVPVLFAFMVLLLVVMFRPSGKLLTALVGGAAVGLISIVYLPLAYFLIVPFKWMVILVPVVGVALFYVGMMYLNDMRSVHPLFAIFLGMLRCTVYLILAIIFMLPGCQSVDVQKYESKVIVLFDVSGSMFTKDDIPEPGQNRETLKTRQDKIYDWMMAKSGDKTFHGQLVAKTPLTMYRFGQTLDEGDVIRLHLDHDKELGGAALRKWLNPNKDDVKKPNTDGLKKDDADEKIAQWVKRVDQVEALRAGTNIGGAALQTHKLEGNGYVQMIIVVSDGQSNLGSDEARNNFLSRVNNPKRPIPVVTVGVGQYRLPVSIEMQELQAPSKTRPDDKFPIRVPVVSSGIPGEKFSVSLEVSRVADINGAEIKGEVWQLDPKEGTFKGAGDKQQDIVEFEIDIEKLTGIKSNIDDSEQKRQEIAKALHGTWKFKAKTPVHRNEVSTERHEKETTVLVQADPLRVLLFAGGATREYQFVRTILVREDRAGRMDLTIYLQSGNEDHIAQDVLKNRMLDDFPDKIIPSPREAIKPSENGEKPMSLGDFDAIIAFDPDWSKLSQLQQKNLRNWVMTQSGGIIFVAGPVFGFQMARPGAYKVEELLKLYPVVPSDSRLHGSSLPGGTVGHNSTRPYALHFSPAAKAFDFVKLDEAGESPTSGWNKFFWNDEDKTIPVGIDPPPLPKRGFFNYYPVERLKPDSQVVATFAGPKESRLGTNKNSTSFIDQQPFMVAMRAGSGKTLYVGSGELWRLRAFKDGYHERMWVKMTRFVAAGATQQKKYGRFVIARKMPVGILNLQVQLKDKDLQPLSERERPTVHFERLDLEEKKGDKEKGVKQDHEKIAPVDLAPKKSEDEWQGYFSGTVHMKHPGTYKLKVPIPGLEKEFVDEVVEIERPDPEKDNIRPNFGYLYQLASDTASLKKNLTAEQLREIERYVQVPTDLPPGMSGSTKRLFFQVESADKIANCIAKLEPKTETIKGKPTDLWESSAFKFQTGRVVDAKLATILAPLVVGLIGVIILSILRQWVSAAVFFGICLFMAATSAGLLYLVPYLSTLFDIHLDVDFSAVLIVLVSLLGIEWLTRKLVRLA